MWICLIILILICIKLVITPDPKIDDYWSHVIYKNKKYNIISVDKFIVYYVDINRKDILLCDYIFLFKLFNNYVAY